MIITFCLFQEKIYHWPAKNEILGKYNSPLYFCFLLFIFSITLPVVWISLLYVLSLKFGIQDFTDQVY